VQDRRFEGVLIVFLDGDKLAWLLRLSPAAHIAAVVGDDDGKRCA
jgi:hypothetical protein